MWREISPIDKDITPSNTTIDYKVSSFLYLRNDKSKNWLLPILVFQIWLGTTMMMTMIENGYAMNKTNLKLQVHQNWTFSLLVTR
jgi:hypothetical protein